MSANDGGPKHYKRGAIQAWDFIVSNELGFLEGNVVKYVTRHKEKGGIEDLRKAMHYLQKLIEVHAPASDALSVIKKTLDDNSGSIAQRYVAKQDPAREE